MEVTEFGMLTLVRLEQPENADLPMEVTEFGMPTLVRLEQPENADSPMEVTEFGMPTLVRPVQPLNALLPIEVTVSVRPLYVTCSGMTISPEYLVSLTSSLVTAQVKSVKDVIV